MRLDAIPWENKSIPITEQKIFLFLDEIEVHLHPTWQYKILGIINNLLPNAQIFISTHSPFIINSIDNAKIYGACPNRMDPPTSHVVTNNIKSVKIIEGPYDVENFGTLSGLVKVETKDPKDGFHGELNLNPDHL